jgi:hypothetical protein
MHSSSRYQYRGHVSIPDLNLKHSAPDSDASKRADLQARLEVYALAYHLGMDDLPNEFLNTINSAM